MDTLRWLRKNGNIVGVEIEGMEINLMGIINNTTLHELYHTQLKKDSEAKSTAKKRGVK